VFVVQPKAPSTWCWKRDRKSTGRPEQRSVRDGNDFAPALAQMRSLIEEDNSVSTFSRAELAGAMRLSARRGWTVVASAFVIMFATFGAAYSFTAFFAPLQQAFGASRGACRICPTGNSRMRVMRHLPVVLM
jgi:hypothetical protein